MAADRSYVLSDQLGQDLVYDGAHLTAGLPLNLEPNRAYRFRACPGS
jgi:hypothetical protein